MNERTKQFWKLGRWVLLGLFILYYPLLSVAYFWVSPEFVSLAGRRYKVSPVWRVDADYWQHDSRFLVLSRMNPLTPWRGKRRILITENLPNIFIPQISNGGALQARAAFGDFSYIMWRQSADSMQSVGVLSGTKYIGRVSGFMLAFETVKDVEEVFSVE